MPLAESYRSITSPPSIHKVLSLIAGDVFFLNSSHARITAQCDDNTYINGTANEKCSITPDEAMTGIQAILSPAGTAIGDAAISIQSQYCESVMSNRGRGTRTSPSRCSCSQDDNDNDAMMCSPQRRLQFQRNYEVIPRLQLQRTATRSSHVLSR